MVQGNQDTVEWNQNMVEWNQNMVNENMVEWNWDMVGTKTLQWNQDMVEWDHWKFELGSAFCSFHSPPSTYVPKAWKQGHALYPSVNCVDQSENRNHSSISLVAEVSR